MALCSSRQLVSTSELFKKALEGKYAVGAYNVNNMEILQAIAEAANEKRAPLILQVSAGARKYASQEYLIKLVEAALNSTSVPIALHLDHGEDFEICKACIDGGFSSVMIDGSKHTFEENIAITKKVVDYAHERGVTVEAELGRLAGVEDDISVSEKDAIYTNPREAKEFVERTGCDSLAVAIGTSHGAFKFKGEAKLDFERLGEIQAAVGKEFPLVLHGASSVPKHLVDICNEFGADIPGTQGVPEPMFTQATQLGVAKINIDTDLRLAFTGAIRKYFMENPGHFDPRQYLTPARKAVKELVLHKMDVLGTSGKA
ncbi:MAG: class II fructose-1,6-bisphosphate aldolase [bacterium]